MPVKNKPESGKSDSYYTTSFLLSISKWGQGFLNPWLQNELQFSQRSISIWTTKSSTLSAMPVRPNGPAQLEHIISSRTTEPVKRHQSATLVYSNDLSDVRYWTKGNSPSYQHLSSCQIIHRCSLPTAQYESFYSDRNSVWQNFECLLKKGNTNFIWNWHIAT